MSAQETQATSIVKALTIKDLRLQCRGRGISPAGGKEALVDRLLQHMVDTKDFEIKEVNEDGTLASASAPEGTGAESRGKNNNYTRPDGQNVGNFLTDRPSSRVLAPPGGGSNWSISDAGPVAPAAAKASPQKAAATAAPFGTAADLPPVPDMPAGVKADVEVANGESRGKNNNYSRPAGQNVGNFITDKSSSRVLAPPGGRSNISFG